MTGPGRPAAGPVLQARGLRIGYGGVPAVQGVDLEVGAGEVVALIGPNGAGKSTTLLGLSGHIPVLAGTITWNGSSARRPAHRLARSGVAFVGEDKSVFLRLTVLENLKVGRVDPDRFTSLFPELSRRFRVKAGDLSGGEQQMLSVGRALCRRPRVLLADELSLGLSPMMSERLLVAIRTAADDDGIGVLLVEQHVKNVLQFADRVYVMRRGEIDITCPADQLLARVPDLERAYLGHQGSADSASAPLAEKG
jgi:ABC-type branched-subunit amino acid transport system ATPase component